MYIFLHVSSMAQVRMQLIAPLVKRKTGKQPAAYTNLIQPIVYDTDFSTISNYPTKQTPTEIADSVFNYHPLQVATRSVITKVK